MRVFCQSWLSLGATIWEWMPLMAYLYIGHFMLIVCVETVCHMPVFGTQLNQFQQIHTCYYAQTFILWCITKFYICYKEMMRYSINYHRLANDPANCLLYLGLMLISNTLPAVDQECVNSISILTYCRHCIDRWTQNQQHFPLMLWVPRLHSNSDSTHKRKQKTISLSLRVIAIAFAIALMRYKSSTYSFAVRMLVM